MSYVVQIVALVGLFLSLEAWRIASRKQAKKKYTSWCDFGKKFSCSKAVTSKYSSILGIRNVIWGVTYYLVVIALIGINFTPLVVLLSFLMLIITAYLMVKQYVLKSVCLLCWGIYLVNVAILVLSYLDVFIVTLP